MCGVVFERRTERRKRSTSPTGDPESQLIWYCCTYTRSASLSLLLLPLHGQGTEEEPAAPPTTSNMATSGVGASSHKQHLLPDASPPPQNGANFLHRPSSKQAVKEQEEEVGEAEAEEDSKAKLLPLTQRDVATGSGFAVQKEAVESPTLLAQAAAALFYAVASLVVIFVNKVWECARRTQIQYNTAGQQQYHMIQPQHMRNGR